MWKVMILVAVLGGVAWAQTTQPSKIDTSKMDTETLRMLVSQLYKANEELATENARLKEIVKPRPSAAKLDAAPVAIPTTEPNGPFALRKVAWGMTKKEVAIAEEDAPLAGQEDWVLAYENQRVVGLRATLVYAFAENKLASAMYFVGESHTSAQLYYEDATSIFDQLNKKYGAVELKEIWRDDTHKSFPKPKWRALQMGEMSLISTWETPTTTIVLSSSSDNLKVSTVVLYKSSKFSGKLEKDFDVKSKKGL